MRITGILMIIALCCTVIGCSGVSRTEREFFTRPEAREQYIADHPDCAFGEHIRNGEITRGMDIYEVIASWGLPNVYLVSKEEPKEFWIYYVQDPDSKSVLIYTLTFGDVYLEGWNIDQKRYDDYRVVSGASTGKKPMEAVGTVKKKY